MSQNPTPSSRFRMIKKLVTEGQNNAKILKVEDTINGGVYCEKHPLCIDVTSGAFKREIDIMSQLQGHPNMLRLVHYEVIDDPDILVHAGKIVTEWCQGTLHDLIKQSAATNTAISEPLLWHCLSSLAEAVRYLQYGPAPNGMRAPGWNMYFHRDLCPSNVFLASEQGEPFPRIVVGDFGCSTSLALEESKARTLVKDPDADPPFITSAQNPDFAPPEAPRFNDRSDIYQIGVVMYCLMMMECEPPSGNLIPRLHENFEYTKDMRDLVSACLAWRPEDRISAQQLVAEVELGAGAFTYLS
ncbi:kinase-like protein [Byssothecium circinans]|uniref:EKC/KEOPS complex subunit BUD32 n=1 Tax=Byssothecium circinans TaxID=147558 RepID=A0A6A5U8E2_9PLEO|nr:kinase-like protein [Byssothecium circinans]